MLKEILTQDVVLLQVDCSEWREAVRRGGELLRQKGCIEERYIDAIIKNHETMGAYMVIAPGIMMAHARPENGSRQNAVSLLTLAKPLRFGSEMNDPVRLVVTLSTADSESHVVLLQDLMKFFSDDAVIQTVIEAKSVSKVMQCIENINFEEEEQ